MHFVNVIFAVELHHLANVRRSLHDLYTLVNVFEVASKVHDMCSGPKILKVGKITCPLRHVSDLILHIVR